MKAAIVTVGDEILIGQIIDTNSAFIAKSLDAIGVEVTEMLSISDNKEHILFTLKKLQNQVNFVIMTGGLGPTKDDITKKTFCDYFDDTLVENKQVLAHVTELIEGFYKRTITQINKDQALVPSQCSVLHNKVGTAPGMWMQKETTVFVSLPGVPFEMKYLVENQLVPKIVAEFERPYIIHKTIVTHGQGESMVAERLETFENTLPDFIKLAYLPSVGKLRLRLSGRSSDKITLEGSMESLAKKLVTELADIAVGFEEDAPLEVVLGRILSKQQKTIATAESCTGGALASLLTANAGASHFFKGSIVAYSAEIKTKVLGVSEAIINQNGVISAEVATAMALGVKNLLATDYAIAITGNAGPGVEKNSPEVGTVFIALATPTQVIVEGFNFGQPREKVIDRAVYKALEILQKEIFKNVI